MPKHKRAKKPGKSKNVRARKPKKVAMHRPVRAERRATARPAQVKPKAEPKGKPKAEAEAKVKAKADVKVATKPETKAAAGAVTPARQAAQPAVQQTMETSPEALVPPAKLPVPNDRTYTRNHEWVKLDEEVVVMGVTHVLLEKLGRLITIELPDPTDEMMVGVPFGAVEGRNGLHEMHPPADAAVLEVNGAAEWDLESLNKDPYGKGWLLKIRVHDPSQLRSLLTAAAYAEYCRRERGRKGSRGKET